MYPIPTLSLPLKGRGRCREFRRKRRGGPFGPVNLELYNMLAGANSAPHLRYPFLI
jgi:hypothetical protein